MSKDIRIASSFPRHPKTKRLRSILGGAGVDSLISFWCWAAEYRPKGNLSGLTIREIEDAAEWRGDTGEFFLSINLCGFIDSLNGDLPPNMPVDKPVERIYLHDWKEHNTYAFFSRERTALAKRAANARWKKHKGIGD